MHNYTENPDNFPAIVQIIDDADPPNAANFNTPEEAQLDREAYLARRLLPSGLTSFSAGLAVPTDLTAITTMVDLETRHIPNYGFWIYHAASAAVIDNTWVVNGHAGVGRWLSAGIPGRSAKISFQQGIYVGTVRSITSSLDRQDPANRVHGLVGKSLVTLASGITLAAGDVLDIAWRGDFILGGSGTQSDLVIGVGFFDDSGGGAVPFFPPNLIDRAAQVDPDVDLGGFNNGLVYTGLVADSPTPWRQCFSGAGSYVVQSGDLGAAFVRHVALVACVHSFAGGVQEFTQGTALSVTQRRVSV